MFLTTEVTTPAYYPGTDKHRLVTNMLFRMGAAAMLFSNKPAMGRRAKYDLVYNHRTHIAASDEAYRRAGLQAAVQGGGALVPSCCMLQHASMHSPPASARRRAIWYGPDAEGIPGVYLGKNVVSEAGVALAKVMTHLAPRWGAHASRGSTAASAGGYTERMVVHA